MKSKIDKNEIVIQGKVLQAKAWPARNGNLYTNGSATLQVGDQNLKVSIQINGAKDQKDLDGLMKSFERTFQQGALVAVTKGQLASWMRKPKEGGGKQEEVFQIDGKLSGSYRVDGKDQLSQAIVSGKIVSAKGGWALVEAFYWAGGEGGRTGELKSRRLKVHHPEWNFEEHQEKHLTVIGDLGQNEKGPFVRARSISILAE